VRLLSIAALQLAPKVGDPEGTLLDFERRVLTLRETFNELQLIVLPDASSGDK
jgi:predicted amidohydrolase